MHQSTFTLRGDVRRQGESDGGDIRRGHPVLSVSCPGLLLEMLACVSIRKQCCQRQMPTCSLSLS